MSWPAPIRKPAKPRLYLTIRHCAKLAGIDQRTMKRWAVREGITRRVAGREMISVVLLQRAFPEIHERQKLWEYSTRR